MTADTSRTLNVLIILFHFKNVQKCDMWVRLCARKDEYFCSIKNVKKDTYICSENNFFPFNILYVIELNYLRTIEM